MDVDTNLVEKEDFESKVLQEAAKSLNFINLLARAYRAPELLDFMEQLALGLERLKDRRS
jgi:hypothetical protein